MAFSFSFLNSSQNYFHVDRIGVCVVVNLPVAAEVDAKTDAAIGVARAFSFIRSDKDPRQALDWILQVI